jgi:RNA recognition motif-containing protein
MHALRDPHLSYGKIKSIKLVHDKQVCLQFVVHPQHHIVMNSRQGKPRGYAFIEFEEERSVKEAFDRADGRKIDGRRVLVDVERGRTVKGWKPRYAATFCQGSCMFCAVLMRHISGASVAARAALASLKRRSPRKAARDRAAGLVAVAVFAARAFGCAYKNTLNANLITLFLMYVF